MDTKNLLNNFKKENIEFKIYNHMALNTVEDSVKMRGEISGGHTKNLFLKNKKNEFFLRCIISVLFRCDVERVSKNYVAIVNIQKFKNLIL